MTVKNTSIQSITYHFKPEIKSHDGRFSPFTIFALPFNEFSQQNYSQNVTISRPTPIEMPKVKLWKFGKLEKVVPYSIGGSNGWMGELSTNVTLTVAQSIQMQTMFVSGMRTHHWTCLAFHSLSQKWWLRRLNTSTDTERTHKSNEM